LARIHHDDSAARRQHLLAAEAVDHRVAPCFQTWMASRVADRLGVERRDLGFVH
jgi:hypothetical protein